MSSGREEGEIDSEEDGLRKRIHELENENAEYEKIKRISESYGDKYGKHMTTANGFLFPIRKVCLTMNTKTFHSLWPCRYVC